MYDAHTDLDSVLRDSQVRFDPEFLETPDTWRREDFADLLPGPLGYEELSP